MANLMQQQNKVLPKEWKKIPVSEVIFEHPKSWIQVNHALKEGVFKFFTSGEKVLFFDKYLIDGENIYLATGGIANVKYFSGKAAYSTDTYAITSHDKDVKYLYYSLLLSLDYINRQFFSGSGLKHLQKNDLKKYEILFPESFPEQQKIAEILTTVDKAIDKTDELIKKHERIKQGMMQELLTKGIDKDGNIRSEETHKFKDSKLGRIPVEWKVVDILKYTNNNDNSIKPGPFGSSLKKKFYTKKGYKIYGQEQVISGNINYGNYYVNKKKYKELSSFRVQAGDILLSCVGTIGNILIIPDDFQKGIINPRLIKITIDEKRTDRCFFSYYLLSYNINSQLTKNATGGTMPVLNKGIILNLEFIYPEIMEQNRIVQKLQSVDQKIKQEELYKQKLLSLKNGLMEDLLIGKVRTNHLLTVK